MSTGENFEVPVAAPGYNRRRFLVKTGVVVFGSAMGATLLGSCSANDEDVTPPEDLMREHGVLNRVLLVYDHFISMISKNQPINPAWLSDAASTIKTFIEDYHEKQEEEFLFPRFEKANKLVDLVKILRSQHIAGRQVTARLLNLAKQPAIQTDPDKQKLTTLLSSFNRMYRPHEAREDTVLFPAIRDIVSKHEFGAMGDDFEKREHELFGKGGFETFVDKIGALEQQLGIYDLVQFTPAG